MTEIYINTETELQPGQVGLGEIFPNGTDNPVMCAIRVIRTATLEEYIDWINEMELGHMVNRSIFQMKFYFVEVLD